MVAELSQELSVTEALRLLGSVPMGRVIFTSRALPAVRPVRHVLSARQVVIAADPDMVLGQANQPHPAHPTQQAGVIIANEADQLDTAGRSGWSVVVIGHARLITDPGEARRCRSLLPELTGSEALIAISTEVVSGLRLVAVPDQPEPAPI
jgi:hypothetical protein